MQEYADSRGHSQKFISVQIYIYIYIYVIQTLKLPVKETS